MKWKWRTPMTCSDFSRPQQAMGRRATQNGDNPPLLCSVSTCIQQDLPASGVSFLFQPFALIRPQVLCLVFVFLPPAPHYYIMHIYYINRYKKKRKQNKLKNTRVWYMVANTETSMKEGAPAPHQGCSLTVSKAPDWTPKGQEIPPTGETLLPSLLRSIYCVAGLLKCEVHLHCLPVGHASFRHRCKSTGQKSRTVFAISIMLSPPSCLLHIQTCVWKPLKRAQPSCSGM